MNYFQFVTWLKSVCDFLLKISPTRMKAPKIFLEQSQENNWFLDISDYFLGTQTPYNTSMEILFLKISNWCFPKNL